MSRKSYLSQQIKLMGLTTDDLLTDAQYEIFREIFVYVEAINHETDKVKLDELKQKKKDLQAKFDAEVLSHAGNPRRVNFQRVMFVRKDQPYPKGITWNSLKITKRIAQFCSQQSRALGLSNQDITFDKIIISWKTLQILKQIVLDGFYMDILMPDDTVKTKHYRFMTASAGQLRTDKIQMISDDAWEKIKDRLMCGLSFQSINQSGGINVNKFLAYLSLPCGATDPWTNFDIDRAIVVNDFEAPVTAIWKYIHPDYSYELKQMDVDIKHTDGCGVMLEQAAQVNGQRCDNFMVRAPWIKGLLSKCDFIKFCDEHNVPAVLQDIWHTQHDLKKQRIYVIFTKSQFKLWNYYKDWQEYKRYFKQYGCTVNRTNFEQQWIQNAQINYQMLQTLQDFPQDKLKSFTSSAYQRIEQISQTKEGMLKALHADKESPSAYCRCLAAYNDILSDSYSKESLKDIKRRMVLDAKSGAIWCKNKRLYALPDFYAVFENWFLHIKRPNGLLSGDEVASAMFRYKGTPVSRAKLIAANIDPGSCTGDVVYVLDVLRSPHLSMEHMICPIAKDERVYEYLNTNGIYLSCHSTIPKRLALDCDGDQLNEIEEQDIILTALDNLIRYNIHTLHYEMGKAAAQQLTLQNMFAGLKRAHDFSGIGVVSNNLTKLWNGSNKDLQAADWLSAYNNFVIDAAKTGLVNTYEKYPSVKKKILRAIGGKKGKMPHFFQFSKNGRRDTPSNTKKKKNNGYAAPNESTMNRISKLFDTIGIIDFNKASVNPFNVQMILNVEDSIAEVKEEIFQTFCDLFKQSSYIASGLIATDESYGNKRKNDLIREFISEGLTEKYGSLENCYPSIARILFEPQRSASNKGAFWNVFGEMAESRLMDNLQNSAACPTCGVIAPNWAQHECFMKNVVTCPDCGKTFVRPSSRSHKSSRCKECVLEYKRATTREWFKTHKPNRKKG